MGVLIHLTKNAQLMTGPGTKWESRVQNFSIKLAGLVVVILSIVSHYHVRRAGEPG
jgi:hypothetical protein